MHRMRFAPILGFALQSLLSAYPADAIFPVDGLDPAAAAGAELLQAVCPGRVRSGKEISCRGACPKGSGFAGDNLGPWTLRRVTLGHFVSPGSDDALLSMEGCEPHTDNFGGTMLLTRRSGRWISRGYKEGVITSQCHKVTLRNGREILVCMGHYGMQGYIWTALYTEDLLRPTNGLMGGENQILAALDNTMDCCEDSPEHPCFLTRGRITKVEFGSAANQNPPIISVTASLSRHAMTSADISACGHQGAAKVLRHARTYHLDYVFDSQKYQATPTSRTPAKMFASLSQP